MTTSRGGWWLTVLIIIHAGTVVLRGVTGFGDSIEDEWLVVYILRELTRKFPDLWVKISDNDGEFLLVEAADALPSWIEPDVASNRVRLISTELLE